MVCLVFHRNLGWTISEIVWQNSWWISWVLIMGINHPKTGVTLGYTGFHVGPRWWVEICWNSERENSAVAAEFGFLKVKLQKKPPCAAANGAGRPQNFHHQNEITCFVPKLLEKSLWVKPQAGPMCFLVSKNVRLDCVDLQTDPDIYSSGCPFFGLVDPWIWVKSLTLKNGWSNTNHDTKHKSLCNP